MASKIERETMMQAADDGDVLASAQLRDLAEEVDNLPAFRRPQRGDWLVFFTDTYFHNGRLIGEDHEYYCIEPGGAVVFETGDLKTFYRDGTCRDCEVVDITTLIRKGAVTHLADWPHNRTVIKKASEN